jgi:hypothetical protein
MQPGGQLSHAQSRSVYGVDGEDRCSLPGGRTLPRRERRGSTSTAGFGRGRLPVVLSRSHACGMFVVSEAEAAAIRIAFDRGVIGRGVIRPPSSCAAPAVPRGGGQRTGAGMRPDHRRLEAAICAATAGQAGPRQVALADAMAANGSAPVEHDEEHGAGLGADAAWLGGPGACPRVSGAEAAARRPGHRQLRGLQSLGVRRRPCPFLADRVCLGPGHWTGGAGHAKPGDSRHLLRFGQA